MDSVPQAPALLDRRVPRSRTWLWVLGLVVVVAAVATPLGVAEAKRTPVVLMGDSLIAEAAPAISTYLDGFGYSVYSQAAVPGSGLLDTQMNWLAKGRELIAQYDPSVVVVEYVGNYAYFGGIPGVSVYTPTFYRDWTNAAQQLENILTSRDATVYWVIGPPVGVTVPEAGIVALDRIYEHLHAPNTASGVPPLIDVTPGLTGGTGKFSEYLPGPGGAPVQVRQPDGVHFTPYGATLLARAIAQAVA
jgi:hypothetical protein